MSPSADRERWARDGTTFAAVHARYHSRNVGPADADILVLGIVHRRELIAFPNHSACLNDALGEDFECTAHRVPNATGYAWTAMLNHRRLATGAIPLMSDKKWSIHKRRLRHSGAVAFVAIDIYDERYINNISFGRSTVNPHNVEIV